MSYGFPASWSSLFNPGRVENAEIKAEAEGEDYALTKELGPNQVCRRPDFSPSLAYSYEAIFMLN